MAFDYRNLSTKTIADVETVADLEEIYQEESDKKGRAAFTDHLAALIETDLSKPALTLFVYLGRSLVRRNYTIVTIAELGDVVGKSNVYTYLKELEGSTLIKVLKKDMTKRGERFIQVSPAYAFHGSEFHRNACISRWYNGT